MSDAHDLASLLLEGADDVDPKSFIMAHGQQLDGPSRKHLFVSSTDGGLYDTRKADWHKGPPLRQNYQKYSARIFNVNDFKATWRARHMSNYPLAFLLSDGEVMCEKCVEQNLRRIIDSTRTGSNDGWRVTGVGQCHGDGDESQCVQCGKPLGEIA